MTSRLLALLALFTLAHAPAGAQSPADFAALEEELAAIVAEHGVVGASVAVSDRDGPVFARGFALADREAGLAASGTTPMRAGSVSKLVTALAAMRLAEAGRLDLEAPLAEIAPDVAFTNRWEEEHPVRLVHLIEHTTGWDDIQLQEYRRRACLGQQLQECIIHCSPWYMYNVYMYVNVYVYTGVSQEGHQLQEYRRRAA